MLIQKREDTLTKMNKWDDFRIRRTKIVDGYIRQRKIMHKVGQHITFMKTLKIMKTLDLNIKLQKLIYKKQITAHFLNVCVAKRWCKSRTFFGQTVEIRNLKDAKNKLSFFTQLLMSDKAEMKSKEVFKEFIDDFISREKLISSFKDYIKQIIYI